MLSTISPKFSLGEILVALLGTTYTIENILQFLGESYPLLIGLIFTIIYRYIELQRKMKRADSESKKRLELKEIELTELLEQKDVSLNHEIEKSKAKAALEIEILKNKDRRIEEIHSLTIKKLKDEIKPSH